MGRRVLTSGIVSPISYYGDVANPSSGQPRHPIHASDITSYRKVTGQPMAALRLSLVGGQKQTEHFLPHEPQDLHMATCSVLGALASVRVHSALAFHLHCLALTKEETRI
jgi:hypothetical protein